MDHRRMLKSVAVGVKSGMARNHRTEEHQHRPMVWLKERIREGLASELGQPQIVLPPAESRFI